MKRSEIAALEESIFNAVPSQPSGRLATFAGHKPPKRKATTPETRTNVYTKATPEVREALDAIRATWRRMAGHAIAQDFTSNEKIIRDAILAYAKSFGAG